MEQILFSYKDSSRVSHDILQNHLQSLIPTTECMRISLDKKYETDYASLHTPFDTQTHNEVIKHAERVCALNPCMFILIGIGGSNLGTLAIHHALQGILYNDTNPSCRLYCADTVDTNQLRTLLALAEQALQQQRTIIVNIVSKSGTTTETIANATLFIALLQKYYPDSWQTYTVVTTDIDSALWQFAHNNAIPTLTIPNRVGGRYSVLSPVGLFPLAVLGIDIHALCAGARDAIIHTLSKDKAAKIPAVSAAIIYENYNNGFTIHDTFVFATRLESMGKWYRQLCAESLGKEYTTDGLHAYIGITPTVSVGSTDLHSVGQLYLGGPYDKFTTFISVIEHISLDVYPLDNLDSLVPRIASTSLSHIMNAIIKGTQTAYRINQRPFIDLELSDLSAYTCGQLMQYKMLEVMYLGTLLKVNPFDQPHVELYKQETRKILAV